MTELMDPSFYEKIKRNFENCKKSSVCFCQLSDGGSILADWKIYCCRTGPVNTGQNMVLLCWKNYPDK